MKSLFKAGLAAVSIFGTALISMAAKAAEAASDQVVGAAYPAQIGFEPAVTPIAHEMHSFHNVLLLPIIIAISIFVAVLLAICAVRFNEKANPVPSKTTHHTALEIAWTVTPVLLLFIIAIPSMKLLTNELVVPKSDMTLKVTGKQWFWSYEYPKDQDGGFAFDSYILKGDDLKPGMLRQLAVDNEAVVPVGKTVHLLVTGADVIHGFVVPSFGVRIDAVPGRLNESWFRAEREGVYYGQCSKLCGKDHAFMPIAFKVVSDKEYTAWLQDAKKKYASNSSGTDFAAVETPGVAKTAIPDNVTSTAAPPKTATPLRLAGAQ